MKEWPRKTGDNLVEFYYISVSEIWPDSAVLEIKIWIYLLN